ncbi:MAG: hypothetical protein EHM41_14520 [Chloroflexi bacterium]|nr:MAG: hypothetical protein EHM41_14520 [Chloroflexota bacterium]
MTDTIRRVFGIFLMLLSAAALILTVYGIFQLWEIKASTTESLTYNLEIISTTLTTTSDGLIVVEEALDTAKLNIASLELTTDQLASSIRDTQPMITSLEIMIGEEVPETITATRTSLNSAQSSALLVDRMLQAISNIPLLGLDRYVPNPPLNETLRDVSSNLEDITPSLETMAESLDTAGKNLNTIHGQVIDIGDQIGDIKDNIEDGELVLEEYQKTVADLQLQIQEVSEDVPGAIDRIFWAVTFVLGWLIITQIMMFTVGYDYVINRRVLR